MVETLSKTIGSLPAKEETKKIAKETLQNKQENILAKMSGQEIKEQEKKKNQKNVNELDNDAFMKLFLEQLKNQDPTAPMETDKIITQTAQLTQVEMMEQNKKTMLEVAEAMKSSKEVNEELKNFQEAFKTSLETLNQSLGEKKDAQGEFSAFNSVAMIGKIAETNSSQINLTEDGKANFSLYFDEEIDTSRGEAMIQILDESDTPVAEISLKDKNGQKGYLNFTWDGKLKNGNHASAGDYKVVAQYNFDEKTQSFHQTKIGRGEVQSVIFKDGNPMLRLGELIVPISSALEFYEKGAL